MARAFPLWAPGPARRNLAGRPGTHEVPPQSHVSSPGPLALKTMPRQFNVRVVGAIGLAVFANTPAFTVDLTCAEIAAFAQEVAQQKAEGLAH
jgi:hypothetical protein